MEIIPIGVGEAFAKTLHQTNFFIKPGEGEPFLIDFGHTAPRALREAGLPSSCAKRVLLSHLHADHIGGLEELGFTSFFIWKDRPDLYMPEDLLPFLWDHALMAGMGQLLQGEKGAFFEAGIETYFNVATFPGNKIFSIDSVDILPFPTPHVPGRPSWGFKLHDRATGKKVFLSCDSKFHLQNLETFARDVDAIFHDCQFTADGFHIHASLEELLTLPESFQKKTILIHYGEDWEDFLGRTGSMRLAAQGERYRF